MSYLETYYRLFKASWGILIGCKGDFIEDPDTELLADSTKIVDGIYFELNISEKNEFIHSNKILLESGIRWIINSNHFEKNVLIRLNEIDINFCNFQVEGLFFASANWVCKYYQVEMPKYYVEYDNKLNKYIFMFENDNEYWKGILIPS